MTFGFAKFAKEDVLWDDTPLKMMQGNKAMLLWMFSDIHLLETIECGWFLLKMHGTAWLSRKWLRGARCTLHSWQKCLKSFRLNLHLYSHRKKQSNTTSKYSLDTKYLSKRADIFISQFPTLKKPKIWDAFVEVFDLKVTTMDLCNLGTDAASTLEVKVMKVTLPDWLFLKEEWGISLKQHPEE